MPIVRVRAKVDGNARQPYAQIAGKTGNITKGPVSGSAVNTPYMSKTVRNIHTVFAPPVKPVSAISSKAERFTNPNETDHKSLAKKRGKNVAEMSDSEFEAFAAPFDDAVYWELQAQRGVYPADDSAEFEDYE